MTQPEPQRIKLGMPQIPIKPEQVKGSDGAYMVFNNDPEPDPLVRVAAVAILAQTGCVVAVAAVRAWRRLR